MEIKFDNVCCVPLAIQTVEIIYDAAVGLPTCHVEGPFDETLDNFNWNQI